MKMKRVYIFTVLRDLVSVIMYRVKCNELARCVFKKMWSSILSFRNIYNAAWFSFFLLCI